MEISIPSNSTYFLTFILSLAGFSSSPTATGSSITLTVNTMTTFGPVNVLFLEFFGDQEAERYYVSGLIASDVNFVMFDLESLDQNLGVVVEVEDVVFVGY